MRVLLVNGSPHQEGCTYTALSEVASALNREAVSIGDDPPSSICFTKSPIVPQRAPAEKTSRYPLFFPLILKNPVPILYSFHRGKQYDSLC